MTVNAAVQANSGAEDETAAAPAAVELTSEALALMRRNRIVGSGSDKLAFIASGFPGRACGVLLGQIRSSVPDHPKRVCAEPRRAGGAAEA